MKKRKKIGRLLNNNNFLINSSVCLVLLLTLCYLGISSPVKKTYAAEECYWYDYENICINQEKTLYGEYQIYKSTPMDDVNIKVDFEAAGRVYEGILHSRLGSLLYIKDWDIFEKTYATTEIEKFIQSVDMIYTYENYTFTYGSGFDDSYLYLNVEEPQEVSDYSGFMTIASPINKCYFNADQEKTVWANVEVGELLSSINDETSCKNTYRVVVEGRSTSGTVYNTFYKQANTSFKISDQGVSESVTGYIFKGWQGYDNKTYYYNDVITVVNNNLHIYGNYSPIKYKVKFNTKCDGIEMADQNFEYDSAQKLTKMDKTCPGKKFIGWSKTDGGTLAHQNNVSVSNLSTTNNAVVNLYGIWSEYKYIVTYDANTTDTVENLPDIDGFNDGGSINISTTIPTRSGYEFTGWNTASDGSGSVYNAGITYNTTASIILYAQWESLTSLITYDGQGGTGIPAKQTKNKGETLQLSKTIPTKEGYEFVEWNTKTDGTGTGYAPGEKYYDDISITLYAKWVKPIEIKENAPNTYKIDKTNIIIPSNITEEIFNNNITLGTGYTIKVDTTTINSKKILYTGGKITLMRPDGTVYAKYTNAVLGDINSTGTIDTQDYVYIYNHLKDLNLTDEKAKAADYNQDGSINTQDYVGIYNSFK